MLLRRLCFAISRFHHNPVFVSPFLVNPSPNFDSYPAFPSNSKSRSLGFQKTIALNSRTVMCESTVDSTTDRPRKPPPITDTMGQAELFRALEASLGTAFSSQPIVPNPNPLVIVISGPSGVGKDAVIKRLREVRQDLHFVVTATTRAKRDGEVDGKHYFFVDKEKFLELIERNELLEYALVYGDYKGIPKQQIREYMAKGFDIVLRVDIQGAATLRSMLKNSGVFVFVIAESEEALVKRLIDRKTESMGALAMRVAAAREELRHLNEFDYVVVNREGELENSVKLLGSIIDAEKAKVRQGRAVI